MSNYSIWKERVALLLEKNAIWEFVAQTQIPPTDAVLLEAHNKKDMKDRRIILDEVKDDIIPHIFEKKAARETWEALTKLYQNDNENQKMALREKLRIKE